MLLTETAHFAQREPAEWGELVALAANSFAEDLPYDRQFGAVDQLWGAVYDLDPERFEANRYFGLGKVACTFGRSLGAPETKRSFTRSAACSLAANARLVGKSDAAAAGAPANRASYAR